MVVRNRIGSRRISTIRPAPRTIVPPTDRRDPMNNERKRRLLLLSWSVAVGVMALVLYLRERERGAGVLDGGRGGEMPESAGALLAVDEATARALFAMTPETFRYDPDCFYRYVPHVDESFDWPEHPRGEWTRTTNRFGWREDSEAALGDHDLRVLVTGDSHTDGACFNDESFPHLLEGLLQAREDAAGTGREVGVQNSGIVGYSFHNYLGVLRMHLDQRPDVFVVAVYGGNDFAESIRPQHHFRGTRPSARRTGYWSRIEAARAVSDHAVAQGLNQVLLFDEQPEEVAVALDAVRVTTRRIRDLCEAYGIRLVFAYVPPAYDAPWIELVEARERAMEVLGLDEERMGISRRLKGELFDVLDDLGVRYVDLEPVFRAEDRRCYWLKDLHIDLHGHAVVARELDAALASGAGAIGELREVADGLHVERDERGRPRAVGLVADGRREGWWYEWTAGGALRSAGRWSAGERVGVWAWFHADGAPARLGAMSGGRPDGVWLDWHEHGRPAQWSSYVDGVPHGAWLQWRPDGSLASAGCYLTGERAGEWWTTRADGSPEARAWMWGGAAIGEVERFPAPR